MKKRSKFNLSHNRLTSFDMGQLVPIMAHEVVPGDTFNHKTTALLRCSPLIAPVMHPVHVSIRHFYVPTRLLWSDFENFITGGPDGNNSSVYPTITLSSIAAGSLAHHLGFPISAGSITVSALPFRAYAMIFNENFRDQDLVAALGMSVASGSDTTTNTTLQNVAWEKDYFTSARPWEQKGSAVTVSLGARAPVRFDGANGNQIGLGDGINHGRINTGAGVTEFSTNTPTQGKVLYTDLAAATGISVNAFREAMAIQRFRERSARHGSRFTEYLSAAFGVKSSDARLGEPEYLGGGKQTIQFSEVLQTAPGTDPVGDLKGHGIAALGSNRYTRFFEEPGIVVSLMFVRPKTIYMGGLPRQWNRRTRFDFLQPEFVNLGSQPILNKEVRAAHANPDGVFAYQDRFDEYRRIESTVTGQFATSTLNHFHLARDFGSDPVLNASFVQCVPTERVFAVPSEDVIWCMVNHDIRARRPLPEHSTPMIM